MGGRRRRDSAAAPARAASPSARRTPAPRRTRSPRPAAAGSGRRRRRRSTGRPASSGRRSTSTAARNWSRSTCRIQRVMPVSTIRSTSRRRPRAESDRRGAQLARASGPGSSSPSRLPRSWYEHHHRARARPASRPVRNSTGRGFASASWQVGVAVVGRTLQPAVGLVGALRLGPRHDVIDIAPVGRHVATGRVLAAAVAHLDGPPQRTREGPLARHRHDGVRAVEEDRLEHGRVGEPYERLWRDDSPGGQLAQPGQRLVADERGEERLRSLRPGGRGRRSRGHLDERGGTPLAGGAHDAVVVVGEAELVGEPAELVEHDAATDRIERGVDDDGAVERLGRVRRRGAGRTVGAGGTAVRVGVLLPVGDRLRSASEKRSRSQ